MANCLGIYLDDNIVKYAKLSVDNNKMVKVEKYGIKFTNQDDKFVIRQIIDETSSQNIPVVINPKMMFIIIHKFMNKLKTNHIFQVL